MPGAVGIEFQAPPPRSGAGSLGARHRELEREECFHQLKPQQRAPRPLSGARSPTGLCRDRCVQDRCRSAPASRQAPHIDLAAPMPRMGRNGSTGLFLIENNTVDLVKSEGVSARFLDLRPVFLSPVATCSKPMARSRRGPGKNSRRTARRNRRRRSGTRKRPALGLCVGGAALYEGLHQSGLGTGFFASHGWRSVLPSTKAAPPPPLARGTPAALDPGAGWKASRRAACASGFRGGRARPRPVRECRLHADTALRLVARPERRQSRCEGRLGIAPLPCLLGRQLLHAGSWLATQLAPSRVIPAIRGLRPGWPLI